MARHIRTVAFLLTGLLGAAPGPAIAQALQGQVIRIGIGAPLTGGAASFGVEMKNAVELAIDCLLYTSPSPRDRQKSRMPSSA